MMGVSMEKKLNIILGVLLVLCAIAVIYLYAVPYKRVTNELATTQAQFAELQTQIEAEKPAVEPEEAMKAVSSQKELVGTVYFNSGDAQLTVSGINTLNGLGDILQSSEGEMIVLEGHSDNMGLGQFARSRYNSNLELSTMRSINVAIFCERKLNISPDRILVSGLSQYKPVADNTMKEDRRKNRRVEIFITPKE